MLHLSCSFFFFNDTATTEIYTLSLHDALPICPGLALSQNSGGSRAANADDGAPRRHAALISRQPADRKAQELVDLADRPEPRERLGCRGQGRAGHGAGGGHLAYQRLDTLELQLLADECDDSDVQRRSVEIALEIEQENLQQRRAIVEGGTAAETGDAVKTLDPAADPHRIDAMLEAAACGKATIGGGAPRLPR